MIAILLMLSIITQVSQQMCRKEYNKTQSDKPLSFSLVGVLATLIYFIVLSGGKMSFTHEMFMYSIPFSICYTIAYVCTIYAIKYGPLSLTSLMMSCSIVVPLLFGVTFLKEPVTLTLIVGLVLLFSCIVLVSEPWKKEDAQISLKWVIYMSATFLANGTCITLQKVFQIKDLGAHSNEFMICSLAITLLTLVVMVFMRERKEVFELAKTKGIIWPILCGTSNGIANQLTMILAVTLPASFLYPVQSAGGIIVTAIVSIIIYKEKLSLFQKIGFVTGILAVIIFNI